MAMAAKTTIATVHEIVDLGELDPEAVVTPGIFVQRIVRIDRVATSAGGFSTRARRSVSLPSYRRRPGGR